MKPIRIFEFETYILKKNGYQVSAYFIDTGIVWRSDVSGGTFYIIDSKVYI